MPDSILEKHDTHYHYSHAIKNIATSNEYEFLKNQIANFNNAKKQTANLDSIMISKILNDMVLGWNKEKNNRRRASICLAGLPNAGKSSLCVKNRAYKKIFALCI